MKEKFEDQIIRLLRESNQKSDFLIEQLQGKRSLTPAEAFAIIEDLIKKVKTEGSILNFCALHKLNYRSLMVTLSSIKKGKKPVDFFPNQFVDILQLIYSKVTLRKEKYYVIKP